MLIDVLRQETIDRALVFTRTKHGADKVVRGLVKAGIPAEAIHGNKSQNQRERVLAAFRKGEIRILVATDIAARGIDVDGISHVVNFDMPNVPETYVHRIGRTARAGAQGVAISLCDGEEMAYLRDIERLIRLSIPLTDRRSPSHRSEAPATKHGHEPSPGAAGRPRQQPRRGDKGRGQRHRNQPSRNQSHHNQSNHSQPNHSQSRDTADGIASVAFVNRPTRRDGAPRPPHQASHSKGS
jgi:superfamily II DNA/RNA helicase